MQTDALELHALAIEIHAGCAVESEAPDPKRGDVIVYRGAADLDIGQKRMHVRSGEVPKLGSRDRDIEGEIGGCAGSDVLGRRRDRCQRFPGGIADDALHAHALRRRA